MPLASGAWMHVKWTRTALLNLDSAVEYIAKDRPMAAKDVGQKIRDTVRLLADHPGMGRPGRLPGTRELVISGLPHCVCRDNPVYVMALQNRSLRLVDVLEILRQALVFRPWLRYTGVRWRASDPLFFQVWTDCLDPF